VVRIQELFDDGEYVLGGYPNVSFLHDFFGFFRFFLLFSQNICQQDLFLQTEALGDILSPWQMTSILMTIGSDVLRESNEEEMGGGRRGKLKLFLFSFICSVFFLSSHQFMVTAAIRCRVPLNGTI
jgi:hypothetical protein